MNPPLPHVFWNKKTLKSLIIPTMAGMLIVSLFFVMLNSAAAVQYSKGYEKGYDAGFNKWDELTDNMSMDITHYTEEGVGLFCSREIYEAEQFYYDQLDRSEMCDAEWMRHNSRLTAYETIYGYISDEDISWAYEMINSHVFVEEE